MAQKSENRKQMTEISNQQSEIRNLPGLDPSGSRYFEGYLAEVFAGIGFQSAIGNQQSAIPVFVHGLNNWVCINL